MTIEIQVIKNGIKESTIYPDENGEFTIDEDMNATFKVVIDGKN